MTHLTDHRPDRQTPGRSQPPAENQLSLLDRPHRATDTSRAAAGVAAKTAKPKRVVILEIIQQRWDAGATAFEIEERTGYRESTVSGRLNDLKKSGLILDSGRRRKSPRNVPCIVYVSPMVFDPNR